MGALLSTQLLDVNDFHANLEPPTGRHRAAARSKGMSTTTVAAGDLVGASPLTSALFHDEPTVECSTQLGVFASATGNHEYGGALAALQRLQHGGCHPVDGCQDGTRFAGAGFTYRSATVTDDRVPGGTRRAY